MPEYRYIAFNQESHLAIAHGPKAAYALHRADWANDSAPIFILDAGNLGREIWQRQLNLMQADQLISENLLFLQDTF